MKLTNSHAQEIQKLLSAIAEEKKKREEEIKAKENEAAEREKEAQAR